MTVQAVLELCLPLLPSAGTKGVHHQTWLRVSLGMLNAFIYFGYLDISW